MYLQDTKQQQYYLYHLFLSYVLSVLLIYLLSPNDVMIPVGIVTTYQMYVIVTYKKQREKERKRGIEKVVEERE